MKINLPYGRSFLTATIPDRFSVDIIEAQDYPCSAEPGALVSDALDNLLGDVHWNAFEKARSVAIAINDKTRPVPHEQLLPPLMARLSALGISDSAITFFVALGTHPPMPAEEFAAILPADILSRYRVVSHDSENKDQLEYMGKTSRGTPIWINKAFEESELKIVVGNIEPHQFAGFSGGVKTAAIGLAGLATINSNHSLMTDPEARLGKYKSNPARQDIEEIGRKIGVHIALNGILNKDRQLVFALAGDPHKVLESGLEHARQVTQVVVERKYGLVVSSPGGYPKDINVYQSQKGLAHASLISRPGATVILVAACTEGTGSSQYEYWMRDKHSYAEVIQQFSKEGFHIGPHKAFQIARDASRVHLLLRSDLNEHLARALLLNPVRDLQNAVDMALKDLEPGDCIGVLPHANSTIPILLEESA